MFYKNKRPSMNEKEIEDLLRECLDIDNDIKNEEMFDLVKGFIDIPFEHSEYECRKLPPTENSFARLFRDSDTAVEFAKREYMIDEIKKNVSFNLALARIRKGIQMGIFE